MAYNVGLESAPKTCSVAELARKVGRSADWAGARLRDGLPPEAWVQRGKVSKVLAEYEPRALELLQRKAGDTRAGAKQDTYQSERARREYYEAELSRVRLEEKLGSLIDADAVARWWQDKVAQTVRRVMQVPQQVAPACVGQPAGDVQALIEGELRAALLELKGSFGGREMVDAEAVPELRGHA